MEPLRRVGLPEEGSWLRTMTLDDSARMELALALVKAEYHHPECEEAQTQKEQRSFCFQHGGITGRAVLLIHGFTACPYEMRELGQYLYEAGYNVVGIRLAGHGTTVADFSKYGRQDWRYSARKGLTITTLLGREAVVVGESMGGLLAIDLAKDYSGLVKRLVLCAPCLKIANHFAWLTIFKWVRRLIPENDMGVQFEWQYKYWYRVAPTSAIAELVKLARQVRGYARSLTTPTLVIQAENDRVVKPKGAKGFFSKLSRLEPSQKNLVLFGEGHHNLTTDLNPGKELVFTSVEQFLRLN